MFLLCIANLDAGEVWKKERGERRRAWSVIDEQTPHLLEKMQQHIDN